MLSNKTIYLPEKDNCVIKQAYQQCKNLGLDVFIPDKNIKLEESLLMLAKNKIGAVVCGVTVPTAEVLRGAIKIIGCKDKLVSSYFIMKKKKEVFLFADCAVVPSPTSEQLAKIAIQTIKSAKRLGINPRASFLSYSTNGSAQTKDIEKIQKAFSFLPESIKKYIAGEWQFDTAYNIKIRKFKNANSPFGDEKVNIYIFPDLNAGNIGYKIAQQLGGYVAVGPILQGLNKPVYDLSRGATVKDVVEIIKIASLYLSKK